MNAEPKRSAVDAQLPPEPDEVGPAVRDVSYQLTNDLGNTGADLRDAAAFAPLALVKLAQRYFTSLSRHGYGTAFLAGSAAALLVAGMVLLRRRRS